MGSIQKSPRSITTTISTPLSNVLATNTIWVMKTTAHVASLLARQTARESRSRRSVPAA